MSKAPPVEIAGIVAAVERRLADFYGFAPQSAAAAHLITRPELKAFLGDRVTTLPEYKARGGVFLEDVGEPPELYIGIHLDEGLRAKLEGNDPTTRLDDGNLDEFCILVEEISHFHLILNRATHALGVTKLELEWQGEIDKLLVCALLLQEQQGDFHIEPLARRLYDGAVIVADDVDLYWQATRHAARFWRDVDRRFGPLSLPVRDRLRRSYRAPWDDKLAQIAS